MSSGSPSQTVHEVGGPARRRPSSRCTGSAGELPLQVVERRVERRARSVLAGRQPRCDLVERPRVVAELDRLEPGERRGGRLVVALDRRRLAEAGDVAVADLDLDDLGLVLRLARDDEGLGEPQRHGAGAQAPPGLH